MELLNMAYDLCEDGDYDQAIVCYDKVLYSDPKNTRALIDKGVTLQNLGENKKSLSLYNDALKIDPDNIEA